MVMPGEQCFGERNPHAVTGRRSKPRMKLHRRVVSECSKRILCRYVGFHRINGAGDVAIGNFGWIKSFQCIRIIRIDQAVY
jgi:hypothetical protein